MNSMCFELSNLFKRLVDSVNQEDYKVVSHDFNVFKMFPICLNH